jgi:hypothetical protein
MLSVLDSPVGGPVAGTPHSGMSIVGYQSGSQIVGVTAGSPMEFPVSPPPVVGMD